MPLYVFIARDAQGKQIHGTQDAVSEYAAIKILQGRNLIITKIVDSTTDIQNKIKEKKKGHRKAKPDDLLFLCRQLAILLEAGIPLLRSLDVISSQIESIQLNDAIDRMKNDIRAGSSLKEAVAKNPKIFPSLWAFLIEAGETSGNLPMVLNQLADHLEANIQLKKKVISAMIYPAVLMGVAFGALLVFMLKIIPIFEKLFKSFNAQLPPLTAAVIVMSQFFQHYFIFMVVGVTVGIYLLKRYLNTPGGRRSLDKFMLKLPVAGALVKDSVLARISINLSTLTHSGVNLLEGIQITARAAGNTVFEEALIAAGNQVQQGKTLSMSLQQQNLFSPIMIHMIMIGEESGRLSDMMGRIAKYHEDKVDVFLSRLSTLIEPFVMLFVGGIIGLLVVAMFLPIMSMSTSIK